MKSEEKNFSGRITSPWYDSDTLCIILICIMFFVFLFGLAGINTALSMENSEDYLKIPWFLTISSFYVFFSVLIRFLKRRKINKALQSLDFYHKSED